MAFVHRLIARPWQTVAIAPRSVPRRLRLYAQDIGDDSWTLPDGTATSLVLLREPVPANLANSTDYIEVAVTDTASTLYIDARFTLADLFTQDLVIDGLARAVCMVGAKGDGTYATYIDRIIIDVERVDSAGFTSLVSKDITLSTPLSNASTSWATWDWQVLLSIGRTRIGIDETIALRVRVYAYMASGGTAQAVRLYYSRGSGDTAVDIPLDEI